MFEFDRLKYNNEHFSQFQNCTSIHLLAVSTLDTATYADGYTGEWN